MAKSNKQLLLDVIAYAEKRGIRIPSDVVRRLSNQDAAAMISSIKIPAILPEDLPIYTLDTPGAVPAPKKKYLVLTSDGWQVPQITRSGGGGSSRSSGGITEAPVDGNAYSRKNAGWEVAAGGGDVVGPASAVGNNFASFNLTTGKLIKDSGSKSSDFATAAHGHAGSAITNTPAGGIIATDVQAAINELDTDKTTLAAVKADADVASAISLKHATGGDTALGAVGVKNPPIDADKAIYRDSTASDALVTSTWTQIKAFLKTYFDGVYAAVLGADDNYVTDAEKVVIGNTSNTNSGDNAANTSIAATKLDDFATPDANTDLNANTTNHGLLLQATAPAAGLMNFVGLTNAETAYTNKPLFDTTNPEALGVAAPGSSLIAARRDHVHTAPAGGGDVIAPATNTDNFIPQWNGANSKTLKDGLELVTTVDATGSDVKIATEQAVREALTALGTTNGWIAASGTWTPRSQAYTNDPAAGANISLEMTDTSGFAVGDVVKVSSSAGVENALITVVTTNTSITVAYLVNNHTTTTPVVKLADTLYVERAYTGDPAAGNNIELAMADTSGFTVGDLVEVSSSAGRENATITVVHANTHLTVNTLALNHTTTSPMVKQVVQNTFIVDTSGDLSGILYVGMRIKFTDTTEKCFILHAIATTRLTLYGGTDYSVVSTAAVTSPNYSMVKAPYGFPISPDKWTFTMKDSVSRVQTTPTASTWYNPGGLVVNFPIGCWAIYYKALSYILANGDFATAASCPIYVTLSTANNSASDVEFTTKHFVSAVNRLNALLSTEKVLSLTSRTNYYINVMTDAPSINTIGVRNDQTTLVVRAVCAYL